MDRLPIEILEKIFSYLSRYNEVSLVSKLFYRLACTVNDPNICLRIGKGFFKHNWLPSIDKSTRKISKLDIHFPPLDDATCRVMISIIARHGDFIKCLSITDTFLTVAEFVEILSLVPNVEHLVLARLHVRDKKPLKRRRVFVGDDDLNLHKLKKLQVHCENAVEKDEFLAVFDRLPAGVLTELHLEFFQLRAVTVLFQRQTNIKQLKVTKFVYNAMDAVHIFDNLQLDSLEIFGYSPGGDMTIFLSKQTQLKTLLIPYANVNDDFLDFVATHTTELKTLSIIITPSTACIASIEKMKSLKELSVQFEYITTVNQVESLVEYPNLEITSLSLHPRCLNSNLVQTLAKSLTKLKILNLYDYDGAIIAAVKTSFNFVEVLHIRAFVDGYEQLNGRGDCYNPTLTELIVEVPSNVSRMYLTKLIADFSNDYPNLKKFQIDCNRLKSVDFRQILNVFTKLESLTLINARWLTVDDLNYLTDHKNNLEFVSLGPMKVLSTDELKRNLSKAFGVIICDDYSVRMMAVDRYTMNRERRSKNY